MPLINKIILIGAVISITALIYITLSKSDQAEADVTKKNYVEASKLKNHNFSKPQNNANIEAATDLKNKETIPDQEDFSTLTTRSKFTAQCRNSMNDFYNFGRKTQVAEMNKKQLAIYSRLENQCLDWHQYAASLSIEEKKEIAEYRKKMNKERRKYDFFFDGYGEPKVIADAVNGLQKGIDPNDPFIYEQLAYLLSKDFDFQWKIAKKLGASSSSMFTNEASAYITQLYMCNYTNQNCGPESSSMLRLCLHDESNCGLSSNQLIQSSVTFGQFEDWQRAAGILHELLGSDWFLQREIVIPGN